MAYGAGMEPPGLWVRRQRKAAGLTQEELAHRSGMSVRTIRNLERNQTRKPHLRSVRLVTSGLGLKEQAGEELITCYLASRDNGSGRPAFPDADQSGETLQASGLEESWAGGGPELAPRQLPPALASFAGRMAELATLDGWLGQRPDGGGAVVISAIGGMAGVGKTTLALHWAHRVAERFPDGQLYVNLRGYDPSGQPADTKEVIRRFLHALAVPPERIPPDAEEQTALYRSLLAGRRMLIMADNAHDAAQVRPLLPAAPGSLVLVTSRSQLGALAAADGARVLNLDVLTAAEAVEMLSARLGAGRVAAQPEAAAELIRLCARLPLALAVAAARAEVSGFPLTALAAQLADARERLAVLGLNDATVDVRAVFSWSCRHLDTEAARTFRLLGVHPGPDISGRAAASLTGLPTPKAQAVLRELCAVSLIAERTPGRYVMHDLVRAYAGEQTHADTGEEAQTAADRMFSHYLHTAAAGARALDASQPVLPLDPPQPGVTPEKITGCDQALAWFGAEQKVLLAVTRQAAGSGSYDKALRLSWALEPFLSQSGHWHDLVASQQAALGWAEHLGDLPGQAWTHAYLGCAHAKLAHADQALEHLTQAVELAQREKDLAVEARANIALGFLYLKQHHSDESISHGLRAVRLAEAAPDPMLAAYACNNVGYQYALQGDLGRALAYCHRALELCGQVGNPELEAHTSDTLGYIHSHLRNHDQAITSYQLAAGLFRKIGARYESAQTLSNLAEAHHAAGDTNAAMNAWQQALAIFNALRHPQASHIRGKLRVLATAEPAAPPNT